MKARKKSFQSGFSLIELLIAMTVMLVLMGIASTLFSRSLSVRQRESQTSDALASAYAALNVMSREISNAGFGLKDTTTGTAFSGLASNGIVLPDSNDQKIHIRSNFSNLAAYSAPNAGETVAPGEDVTYYFEPTTRSIVRYDPHSTPTTSVVVNRISNVTFGYYDYATSGSSGVGPNNVPTEATGRIVITVTVDLDYVQHQTNPGSISFQSEVNMRNSNYMLQQY
jgi:prepilin-type N-terminal cleavage/methylation domain-containing protein